MKNSIRQIGNIAESLHNTLGVAEERISNLEDKYMEISQTKKEKQEN